MSRAPKKERMEVQLNTRISRRMRGRLDATAKRYQLRDASKLVRGGILLAIERPREALDAERRVNGSRVVQTSEEASGAPGNGTGGGSPRSPSLPPGPTSPRALSPAPNGQPESPAPVGTDAPTVHLPTVLSTWTGMPRSLARMALAQGRVTVAGEVPVDDDVPKPERRSVLLDGRPV